MKTFFKTTLVQLLVLSLVSLGSPAMAKPSIISTLSAIESQSRNESLATINAALTREEVRTEMTALGVDAAQIDARLAALTDSELRSMAERISTLPAGGDALAVIGVVFLVLLILEAVGVLDIFKKFP